MLGYSDWFSNINQLCTSKTNYIWLLYIILFYCFVWLVNLLSESNSCSTGWPQNQYETRDDLELLVLRTPSPKCLAYRHVPPHWFADLSFILLCVRMHVCVCFFSDEKASCWGDFPSVFTHFHSFSNCVLSPIQDDKCQHSAILPTATFLLRLILLSHRSLRWMCG